MRKLVVFVIALALGFVPSIAKADFPSLTQTSSFTATGSVGFGANLGGPYLTGQSTCATTLSGTWVGSVVFEGANDSVPTWTALSTVTNTGSPVTQPATTNGLYLTAVPSVTQFRARVSAYTSGTVVATVTCSGSVTASGLTSSGGGAQNVTITSPIGQKTMANSVSTVIASDQSNVPVGIASPLGQALMAASVPVVLSSNHSTISVTTPPPCTAATCTTAIGQGANTAIVDASGQLKVNCAAGCGGGTTFPYSGAVGTGQTGTSASFLGAAGTYYSTAPSPTNGQVVAHQMDARGNLKVNICDAGGNCTATFALGGAPSVGGKVLSTGSALFGYDANATAFNQLLTHPQYLGTGGVLRIDQAPDLEQFLGASPGTCTLLSPQEATLVQVEFVSSAAQTGTLTIYDDNSASCISGTEIYISVNHGISSVPDSVRHHALNGLSYQWTGAGAAGRVFAGVL